MESWSTSSLHHCTVQKSTATINRLHTFSHLIALIPFLYYRLSSNIPHHTLPITFLSLLIFASELLLSFLWLLNQAYGWRPVSRSAFPDRLPDDDELPAVDVFICTSDPEKEPAVGVVSTVLSAMALDYPPEKLSVYLSDDAGSPLTLNALREAWGFAGLWVPFCRRHGVKTTSPEAYFSSSGDGDCDGGGGGVRFMQEKEEIERKYEQLKERLKSAAENGLWGKDPTASINAQNHPPVIEVMGANSAVINASQEAQLPLLVYVSREKKPSHSHNFKAGALNVLLRVSGIITNAPYILVLDCDMYSNDPSSARQAMCFHLDPIISPSLAFVQFPQKFHNISKNDIYNAEWRSVFMVMWPGMDGLKGPVLSGTCFYIKRKALYGTSVPKGGVLSQLQQSFGSSNELIKSLDRDFKRVVSENDKALNLLLRESKVLASCTYEKHTKWGRQIGFMYSVVEDFFTSLVLHCNGWSSVFCNPQRPAFLGSCTTCLNDTLVQGTRLNSGLLKVGLSWFPLLLSGLPRMSLPEGMCYAYLGFQPLYFFPVWCLATIPQLCLLNGIAIYPKVSSPWFMLLCFIFLSPLLKRLFDVLVTGGSIQTWLNEWRIWMIKSVTACFYGSLDAILELMGIRKASFLPTSKVANDEKLRLYQMGKFDLQASPMLLAPLVTLVVLNAISFGWGVWIMVAHVGGGNEMFGQIFLSFFVLVVHWPFVEGMMLRKDKGSIPPSVTMMSVLFSLAFLFLGSVLFMY